MSEIAQVPVSLMILCLCYVLLQILKRFLFKSQNWWDWLYYVGLLSVMIPTYMINEDNESMFTSLATYGTVFLIIPVLFDVKELIENKK